MARAKTKVAAEEPSSDLPPIEQKLRKCCGTCKHFRPFHNRPSLGRCEPSMAIGSTYMVFQDLSCCSDHQWKFE
jgi:hypothetical protein